MSWFRKKSKESPQEIIPPESVVCQHHYKDFGWYLKNTHKLDEYHNTLKYTIQIIAPYVCIHCKHREDRILSVYEVIRREQFESLVEDLEKNFPKLREPAIVEDEINDFQLIDAEYLKIAAQLFPNRNLSRWEEQKIDNK